MTSEDGFGMVLIHVPARLAEQKFQRPSLLQACFVWQTMQKYGSVVKKPVIRRNR
jgi:hypothetical protein